MYRTITNLQLLRDFKTKCVVKLSELKKLRETKFKNHTTTESVI